MAAMSVDAGKEERAASTRGRLVHSQVRRIREEDQRIGEGTGEGLGRIALLHLSSHVGAILCSRPAILRSSPLGRAVDPSFR